MKGQVGLKNKKSVIAGLIVLAALIFIGVRVYQLQNDHNQTDRVNKVAQHSRKQTSQANRTIVVFFSRAGQNYPNRDLKVGDTNQIANLITQQTGAKQYRIVPKQAYPYNYQATVKRATREQNENARPKIKNKLPNFKKYDTIFLGYPIWDAHLPMILHTFMASAQLNGKIIIPFSTNAGSGWSDSLTMLRKQYPQVTFKKGLSIQGSDVKYSHAKIEKWLNRLGY